MTRSKATEGDLAQRPWAASERRIAVVIGTIFALPAVTSAWLWYHPLVRVINTSGRPVVALVDGRAVAYLPPVSAETPNTGFSARVRAGTRALSAKDDEGREVWRASVEIVPGREHLWAPAHGTRCFLVEATSYGAAVGADATAEQSEVPLDPSDGFWELPVEIDAWFEPNPEPGRKGPSWSGGVRHALREGDCHRGSDAPRIDLP